MNPYGKVGVTGLQRATAFYVNSKRYYFASAQADSMRHDVDGKPAAPLRADDRAATAKCFLKVKRDLEENSAGTTDASFESDKRQEKTDIFFRRQ